MDSSTNTTGLSKFINKLSEADEKDKHIGQDPVPTRGGSDI